MWFNLTLFKKSQVHIDTPNWVPHFFLFHLYIFILPVRTSAPNGLNIQNSFRIAITIPLAKKNLLR